MKNDRGGRLSAGVRRLAARSALPGENGMGCIFYVRSGSGIISWAQGERAVSAGQLLVLGRGSYERHCELRPGPSEAIELLGCSFSLDVVNEQQQNRFFAEGQPLLLQGNPAWSARMRTLLELMEGACQEPDCPARLWLALLLHYAGQEAAAERAPSSRPQNDTVERICDYLAANYQQKLTLGEVAAKFYLSPYYLSRLFRQVTGQSIVDYINVRRIEAAQRLLENTDMKINLVAEATGFATTAHFRRVFHEQVGVAPTEYRKACRGKMG